MDTEKNTETEFTIPYEIMLEAVGLFALGLKRSDIVERFLAEHPTPDWLHPLENTDRKQVRTLISQKLRQADPTSSKYAETKYEAYARNIRGVYWRLIHEKVDQITYDFIQDALYKDPNIRKLMRRLKKKITNAVKDGLIEIIPTIPSQETTDAQTPDIDRYDT